MPAELQARVLIDQKIHEQQPVLSAKHVAKSAADRWLAPPAVFQLAKEQTPLGAPHPASAIEVAPRADLPRFAPGEFAVPSGPD